MTAPRIGYPYRECDPGLADEIKGLYRFIKRGLRVSKGFRSGPVSERATRDLVRDATEFGEVVPQPGQLFVVKLNTLSKVSQRSQPDGSDGFWSPVPILDEQQGYALGDALLAVDAPTEGLTREANRLWRFGCATLRMVRLSSEAKDGVAGIDYRVHLNAAGLYNLNVLDITEAVDAIPYLSPAIYEQL